MSETDALSTLLRRAQSLGVEGDLERAGAALEQALALAPDDARVLHLLGVTRWQTGDLDAASALLARAAQRDPQRAEAHYALAKVTEALHGPHAALPGFARTVELAPGFAPAWADLGIARAEAGDLDGAVSALSRVRQLGAADAGVLYALGRALSETGRTDAAVETLREARDQAPRDPVVLRTLASALRAGGDTGEARRVLDEALVRAPDDVALNLEAGAVLDEIGEPASALLHYRRAVASDATSLPAHDALNRALWEAGRHDEHLSSYRTALERQPGLAPLRRELARWLVRTGRHDEAAGELRRIMDGGSDADSHRLMARALANSGDSAGALGHFRRAVELSPDDAASHRDLARLLLILDEVPAALEAVQAALALDPLDQEAIAYLGLCWRLGGTGDEAVLNDYGKLVRTYRIPVPAGHADIASFNRALNRDLDTLHGGAVHPSDQTLRGGTQTHGDLFASPLDSIRLLRESIERCVAEYIDAMEADPQHPLTSRRSRGFRFAASWSCRLRQQGFHTNHVHPKGWISSCYYVSLPTAVHTAHGQQGWIRFGESSLRLGARERIGRTVQPEEGLLVLFPSYMFHGTVPFESDELRTTVAFDVLPTDEP